MRCVYWFYNLALRLTYFFLGFLARFNPKIRLFVEGRKQLIPRLANAIAPGDQVIWIHTASLGEYEQGLPVIRQLKQAYPSHKLLVTFFSPSGYEVKKDSGIADIVSYLPMDTRKRVRTFLDTVSPSLALFVKYEIWPNYFRELKQRGVPILLVSAIFKKDQVFFKWYGGFMRKSLRLPTHIFVQDQKSLDLLESAGIGSATVSGDTRFDRVSEILGRDNSLPFMETFRGNGLCLVCGSTWPEDEALLLAYINQSQPGLKAVLAPHDIHRDHIERLKHSIDRKVLLYSEITGYGLGDAEVLIVDTIGLLTKIYSYADIAYVGGGFATGLHNTLEPAVFGIPVLIGPHYHKFREAADLVALGGLLVVTDAASLKYELDRLVSEPGFRKKTGHINASYVREQRGASIQIMQYIRRLL